MTHERPTADERDASDLAAAPQGRNEPTEETAGAETAAAADESTATTGAETRLDEPGGEPAVARRDARTGSRRLRRLLRDVADRLATRRASPPPRVARVFDGQRDGRPWFAPEHPVIVDHHERDALLGLLRCGSVVVHAAHPLRDDLGEVDAVVPASLRSDGAWIWSDAVAYYLEHHWLAPEPELVAHLRTAGPATPIDAATWRRLSAAIRPDAQEGTTWPLD